jgi:hypothetical protein
MEPVRQRQVRLQNVTIRDKRSLLTAHPATERGNGAGFFAPGVKTSQSSKSAGSGEPLSRGSRESLAMTMRLDSQI